MRTLGISPKVKLPAGALAALGVLLLVAGALVPELAQLRDDGLALIAASGLAGLLGYRADPAEVEFTQEDNLAGGVLDGTGGAR